VELDIRKTKDGRMVVIHDAEVDRTTNGRGPVSGLTLDEVKRLTTWKSEKIPTLEEALDFLDRKVKILVELKEIGLERNTLSLIREKGLEENVVIVSFHEEALRRMRKLSERVETGLIYVRHENPIETALRLKTNYMLPFYKYARATDVEKAHERGLKVIVWTINEREEAMRYVKWGVDGVASDKPDILKGI
jgi:glycerophosphoryl diester phosphodiesterase